MILLLDNGGEFYANPFSTTYFLFATSLFKLLGITSLDLIVINRQHTHIRLVDQAALMFDLNPRPLVCFDTGQDNLKENGGFLRPQI